MGEKERVLMLKQRGIMRRIVDKNARMVSAGYNKLIEEWKVRQNTLKDKLKFVIKALTDKDAAYILAGSNGLKQRALMLRKSQRRSRKTRVRKTTKRKRQNPQKNHGLQRQNDGSRIQTSLPMDGTRQRKGKSPHAQTKRNHEKNRRQKRQNGLRRIQQVDRRMEGQAKHLEGQTQVRHQGSYRQGRRLYPCWLQRPQTKSSYAKRSRNGRRRHEEDPVDQETHQPRLQPPSHGCQRTQRVLGLRKSQRRSRKTRVRKTKE